MINNLTPITLVIFTCEGKEHLLPKCYESFMQNCDYTFSQIILAVDGIVDQHVIRIIKPDLIIQNFKRKGYIFNIINALNCIKTDFFFWLEDDYYFNQPVNLKRIVDVLTEHKNWSSIFLTKIEPLKKHQVVKHYFDEFYLPDYGLSVSPSVCRTKHIIEAFKQMVDFPKSDKTTTYGFETFVSDFLTQNNFPFALMDSGPIPHAIHLGGLESTNRKFHMINSLEDENSTQQSNYISGFGSDKKITYKNRFNILLKLWYAALLLSVKLFKDREAYDFAFRIYTAKLKKFKS